MSKVIPKDQIEYVRQIAWHRTTEEVRTMLNEKFGTDYTYKQIKSIKQNHKIHSGLTGQFEKGHKPWTKGKSIEEICYKPDSYARWDSHHWYKGHRPYNAVPVGTETVDKYGYIKVKIAEPNAWEFKHRIIYEKAYGPIPKGMLVALIDGDKTNLSPENMMLIDQHENGFRHRYAGMYEGNHELGKAVILNSKLQSRIEELDGTREIRKEKVRKELERRRNKRDGQN